MTIRFCYIGIAEITLALALGGCHGTLAGVATDAAQHPDSFVDSSTASDSATVHRDAPSDSSIAHVTDAASDSNMALVPDVPLHITATPCDQLGDVGVWQEVSPAEFHEPNNRETTAVVVDPRNQAVYASATDVTNGGNPDGPPSTGIMRSLDCGSHWELVGDRGDGHNLTSGAQWALAIDPSNPDVMYSANGYGNQPTIYRSDNSGMDWRALAPDPSHGVNSAVQAIAIDVTDAMHIGVTFHADCTSPHHPNCLSTSRDRGETWQIFDGPPELLGWHEASALAILGASSYLYSGDFGAFFTDDNGANWHRIIDGVMNGSYNGSAIVISGTVYVAGANAGVFTAQLDDATGLRSPWTQAIGVSACSLATDGISLFGGNTWDYGGSPVWQTPLSDRSRVQTMSGQSTPRGPYQLAYDATHGLLYAANMVGGLWRVRMH